MRGADLSKADLSGVDLRNTDLRDVAWKGISSMQLANLAGARNASPEFMTFAVKAGAVNLESDEQWEALLQKESQ